MGPEAAAETMLELANEVRAGIEGAATRLRTLSDAEAARAPSPERWTIKENLAHLIDSTVNHHQCFVRAGISDSYVGPGYDQDAWVSVHRHLRHHLAQIAGRRAKAS